MLFVSRTLKDVVVKRGPYYLLLRICLWIRFAGTVQPHNVVVVVKMFATLHSTQFIVNCCHNQVHCSQQNSCQFSYSHQLVTFSRLLHEACVCVHYFIYEYDCNKDTRCLVYDLFLIKETVRCILLIATVAMLIMPSPRFSGYVG